MGKKKRVSVATLRAALKKAGASTKGKYDALKKRAAKLKLNLDGGVPKVLFDAGDEVSILARSFGDQWAKKKHGKGWRKVRVLGIIKEHMSGQSYKVRFEGGEKDEQATGDHLLLVKKYNADSDEDDEETLSDEESSGSKVREPFSPNPSTVSFAFYHPFHNFHFCSIWRCEYAGRRGVEEETQWAIGECHRCRRSDSGGTQVSDLDLHVLFSVLLYLSFLFANAGWRRQRELTDKVLRARNRIIRLY